MLSNYNHSPTMRFFYLLLALLLGTASVSRAQSTGVLSGTVRDRSTVPNATKLLPGLRQATRTVSDNSSARSTMAVPL